MMQIPPAGTYGRPYPTIAARCQHWATTLHTLVYRLSAGQLGATPFGMPMLLLTTWGRRSGKLRTTPLLYLPVGDKLVLVASNGGARQHPSWWLNLLHNPQALVQIGPTRGRVQARSATPIERQHLWPLMLQLYPRYASYQSRTDRAIPLMLLAPIDMELYRAIAILSDVETRVAQSGG